MWHADDNDEDKRQPEVKRETDGRSVTTVTFNIVVLYKYTFLYPQNCT